MDSNPAYEIMYGIVSAVPVGSPEDQGGTVSMTGEELPIHGYFVGGVVEELIFNRFVDIDGPSVVRFVDANPSEFIGWWVDEVTHRIHIDSVEWFEDYFAAQEAGLKRNEIAVWDVANGKEIRL